MRYFNSQINRKEKEKMAKDTMTKYGSWAFLIGIVISLIVGIYTAYTIESNATTFFSTDAGGWIAWLLAIIGAIVGILAFLGKGTITEKEVPGFLMAGIALVVMYGVFQGITIKPLIGALLAGVSQSLAIFVAPAVGILAIKAIWDIGKEV
jgi:heme/copper-type cytochrome/quinol oxidase subunit 4